MKFYKMKRLSGFLCVVWKHSEMQRTYLEVLGGGNTLQGSEGGRVGLRKTLQMRSQLILQGVLEQA